MEHLLNFEYILDTMSNNYGLTGIFANSGFGKTTLMMQIIDEINKRKDGTAIVMSNESFSKENWINQMVRINLSTERVVIDDKPIVSHADIYNSLDKLCKIEKKKVCDYLQREFLNSESGEGVNISEEIAKRVRPWSDIATKRRDAMETK